MYNMPNPIYVGGTGREPVSNHFIKNGHPLKCEITDTLKGAFPLKDPYKTFRLTRESHWIHQLQTYIPNGMNVRG